MPRFATQFRLQNWMTEEAKRRKLDRIIKVHLVCSGSWLCFLPSHLWQGVSQKWRWCQIRAKNYSNSRIGPTGTFWLNMKEVT